MDGGGGVSSGGGGKVRGDGRGGAPAVKVEWCREWGRGRRLQDVCPSTSTNGEGQFSIEQRPTRLRGWACALPTFTATSMLVLGGNGMTVAAQGVGWQEATMAAVVPRR